DRLAVAPAGEEHRTPPVPGPRHAPGLRQRTRGRTDDGGTPPRRGGVPAVDLHRGIETGTGGRRGRRPRARARRAAPPRAELDRRGLLAPFATTVVAADGRRPAPPRHQRRDRKSTRLNSSHVKTSYA